MIPQGLEVAERMVEDGWRFFSSLVDTGPFGDLLPSKFTKKEVMSQILYGSTMARVCAMHNAPIVSTGGPLWLD